MTNATIQRNAFIFCRYSVAILVWGALVFRNVYALGLVFVILALSAFAGVHRAPMVQLYTKTLGRVVESKDVVLDVRAMRFAHTAGAVMALVSVGLVLSGSVAAWPFVAFFAVLKTASAVGLCPAYRLYGCMSKGGCCAFTGKR